MSIKKEHLGNPLILLVIFSISLFLTSCQSDEQAEWIAGIRNVSKYASVKVEVDKIIYSRQKKVIFFVKVPDATHVAYSSATIKLGVNLDLLGSEDVSITGQRISILLPPVEIIDFTYRPTNFIVDENFVGR